MCLTKITNEVIEEEGIGWKIYEIKEDKILTSWYQKDVVLMNQWMKADNYRIPLINCGLSCRNIYRHGFHIYKNKENGLFMCNFLSRYFPQKSQLVLVKYRKLITSGRTLDVVEIVAEEIFVPIRIKQEVSNDAILESQTS